MSWNQILTVEIKGVSRRYLRLKSTRDAAHYLVELWDGPKDAVYRDAVIACTKALKGQLDDATALQSFLAAASRSNSLQVHSVTDMSWTIFEHELSKALQDSLQHERSVVKPAPGKILFS
jgi:Protein of unknown function (DUF982).